jgi:predicted  nucleic acid-binding Zn-ribbon protein
MKYYSEVTKQMYDTEQALLAAEQKVKEAEEKVAAEKRRLKEEKAARTKEMNQAFDDLAAARNRVNELLLKYTQDYGYFSSDNGDHLKTAKSVSKNSTDDWFDALTSFLLNN